MDRMLGNAEGWAGFDAIPQEVGAATHAYAAFEPSIESTSHMDNYLNFFIDPLH